MSEMVRLYLHVSRVLTHLRFCDRYADFGNCNLIIVSTISIIIYILYYIERVKLKFEFEYVDFVNFTIFKVLFIFTTIILKNVKYVFFSFSIVNYNLWCKKLNVETNVSK